MEKYFVQARSKEVKMKTVYAAFYTKSLIDDSPANNCLIHAYHNGEEAVCGKDISGDRWYIADIKNNKITCKKCLKEIKNGN